MKKVPIVIIGSIFGIIITSIVVLPIILSNVNDWPNSLDPKVMQTLGEFDVEKRVNDFETYIWRDYMPGSLPRGLFIIVKIDSYPLEDIQRIWLINDTGYWSSSASEGMIIQPQNEFFWGDGPYWNPYIYIDVVLEVLSDY